MHESSICPVCNAFLGSGTPPESCPVCLLGMGLETHQTDQTDEVNMIAEQPGDMVGRYLLVKQIGEGGFGVVFRAEQKAPVRRTVALKVIKPGMDSREVVTRFEAERQALALMDHPNIAKVYDAGTTDLGRPYFVMEHVEGLPLTTFCDGQALGIRARLELFVRICEAVQHAHQKGVIHRDLKPSNILVRERDEDNPRPKIIDFGVAKAIGVELTDKTFLTMFGRVLGTPMYMSPEQAGLNEVDVDTRGDIYSLGVVLYELLTGDTPLGSKSLSEANFDETRRRIREEEPLRPSARIFSLPSDQRRTTASVRQIDPAKYRRYLSGDLDWIVMKALEKDRNRRYDTAQGFARDVRRYLDGLPVSAGPPEAAYWIGKFVRRNRGPVLATALAVLTLITALVVGGVLSRKAEHEKEYAILSKEVADVRKWRKEEPGSRERAIKTLRHVATYPLKQIGVTGDRARKLRDAARNELIACLAWTDLEKRSLPIGSTLRPDGLAALDSTHQRCVLSAENGSLELWNTATKKRERVSSQSDIPVKGPLRFSHNGALVAAGFGTAEHWNLVLWNWFTNTEIDTNVQGVHAAFDFHPHEDGFVVGTPAGTIDLFSGDGTTRRELVALGEPPLAVQFSPDGRHVAIGTERSGVVVIDVATGEREVPWAGVAAASLAWAPDGRSLVAGDRDSSVAVLERGVQKPVFIATGAHSDAVDQVAWSSDGRLIASGCRDEIRLWDGRQGKLLCEYIASARTLAFSIPASSHDEQSLGPVLTGDGTLGMLDIQKSGVCHRATGHLHHEIIASTWAVNGTVLVTAADDGLRLWNREGLELSHDPEVRVRPGGLTSGPDFLYLATENGVSRRRISTPGGRLSFGNDEMLDAETRDGQQILLIPPHGPFKQSLAVARDTEVVLLDPVPGTPVRLRLKSLPSTAFLTASPDGDWLAAGTSKGKHVRIWKLDSTGGTSTDLPVDRPSTVAFYPLTKHPVTKAPFPPFLMTGNDEAYRMWTIHPATGSWIQKGDDHPSKMTTSWGRKAQMVFSPRGTVVAVTYDKRYLQVLNPITLELMTQPGFDEQWPLTISPTGQWMATEGPKGRLFIWDLAEVRNELKTLDWPPTVLPPFRPAKSGPVLPSSPPTRAGP